VSAGLARDLHRLLVERHPDWRFLGVPDLGAGCGTVPATGSEPHTFGDVRARVVDMCGRIAGLGYRLRS